MNTENHPLNRQPQPRNHNLDLLRTVAMLFVVLLHFTCYGVMNYGDAGGRTGGLQAVAMTIPGIFDYGVAEALTCFACTGVNLFVLLSGYFLVSKKFHLSRIVKIWVEMVFYLFAVVLALVAFTDVRPGLSDWVNFLDPIRTSKYWFVTYYIEMVFLAPFMGILARAMTKRQYQYFLLVATFFSLTFLKRIPYGELNGMNNGFGLPWFIYLFFVAGYLRLHVEKVKHVKAGIIVSLLLMMLQIVGVAYLGYRHTGVFRYSGPIWYNGFAFFLSVALFLYFKQRTWRNSIVERLGVWMAPYVFGVYLIHTHPFIQDFLWGWRSWFTDFGSHSNTWTAIPWDVCAAFIVFVLCVLIDYFRTKLFNVLHISEGIDYLSNQFMHKFNIR